MAWYNFKRRWYDKIKELKKQKLTPEGARIILEHFYVEYLYAIRYIRKFDIPYFFFERQKISNDLKEALIMITTTSKKRNNSFLIRIKNLVKLEFNLLKS